MSKINVLKAALFTPMGRGRWGLAINMVGPPGVAKSAFTEALAIKWGLHYQMLSPGLHGEGAFGVVPVPNGDLLTYPPPDWTQPFFEAERGLLHVDEASTAPPALQPYLLGLIQLGQVGSTILPPGVRRLASMNPTDQAAGGWDLAPPVANRMGWMDWEGPDTEEWGDWLLGEGGNGGPKEGPISAVDEERRVMKAWPVPWAKARGIIRGFIRRRPELLHKMPKAGDPNRSRAWPSHRTWEYATRAMAAAEVHGLNEVDTDLFVSAFVGNAAAMELATWRAEADLPDPADLLDGKVPFEHDPKRLDRTLAMLSACAALVIPEKAEKRQKRSAQLWGMLGEVVGDAADLTVPAARALVKAKMHVDKTARPVLLKLSPVLTAAGVMAA